MNHSNNADSQSNQPPDWEHFLGIYTVLINKLNQEGDGIWSRFNMLVALNFAVFAGFGLVRLPEHYCAETWRLPLCGIAISGLLLSVWSVYCVGRLWTWHAHWIRLIRILANNPQQTRSTLSTVLKHTFDKSWDGPTNGEMPEGPQREQGRSVQLRSRRSYWRTYTQPVLLFLAFAWVFVLLLMAMGRL